MLKLPFGKGKSAGGPERSSQGAIHDVVDPLVQQIAFLASDKDRVPDDKLADEIRQLHPERSDYERALIVLAVFNSRHPELNLRETLRPTTI